MQNTAQWIMVAAVIAVGATFTHHYKTGGVMIAVIFGLCMLPPGVVLFDPGQAATVPLAALATLPAILAWAWPVIAIVGLFVLVSTLFPSKASK